MATSLYVPPVSGGCGGLIGAPVSTQPGPLGLEGTHRELADLIRSSERLTCGEDDASARDTAGRIVDRLVRHLDEERNELECLDAARRQQLQHGQRTLLARAAAYASAPAPDAGADLLALLVRQADAEHSAFEATRMAGRCAAPIEFPTEWTVPPAIVAVDVLGRL